jgi:hypothetical protein
VQTRFIEVRERRARDAAVTNGNSFGAQPPRLLTVLA